MFLLQTYRHPEWNGPYLGPKPADECKRDFSEEVLKAGQTVIGLQAGSNKGATQAGQNLGAGRKILLGKWTTGWTKWYYIIRLFCTKPSEKWTLVWDCKPLSISNQTRFGRKIYLSLEYVNFISQHSITLLLIHTNCFRCSILAPKWFCT